MASHTAMATTPHKSRKFKRPVRWLLGGQLIGSLKRIALYTAYKGKMDSRDWMEAGAFPSQDENESKAFWGAGEEFWFDYIADSGDGMTATYSVAYLCNSDLWIEGPKDWLGQPPEMIKGLLETNSLEVGFVGKSSPDHMLPLPAGQLHLPRGKFLVVGGDTAYHIADYATLHLRFQTPFNWAWDDLGRDGRSLDLKDRPIFGVPGNHDYYDVIDGFNRQFRLPLVSHRPGNRGPQLAIHGFRRYQTASYFALQLPFKWWLWGLDCEIDKLDFRQREFFQNLNGKKSPDRLIVATPEPTTVKGLRAKSDDKTSRAFLDLELEAPFLDGEKPLPKHRCRLDISGDTHHYARYWGPDSRGLKGSPSAAKSAVAAENYASVVSGMGGAFFHPSDTDVNQVEEQALYPSAPVSRRSWANRLLNPWVIFTGGYIFPLGAVIAATVYWAATVPQSTKGVVDSILAWVTSKVDPLSTFQIRSPEWPGLLPDPQTTIFKLSQNRVPKFTGSGWPLVFLLLSIALIIVSIACSRWILDHPKPESKVDAEVAESGEEKKVTDSRWTWILGLVCIAVFCLVAGGERFVEDSYRTDQGGLSPFGASLLVLACLVWFICALGLGTVYSERLSGLASKQPVTKWDYWPVWVLVILAQVILVSGGLFFGKAPAAYLLSDIAFAFLCLAVIPGLIAAAIGAGSELHSVPVSLPYGILGAWHGLLQLATPFLLIRTENVTLLLLAILFILVFNLLGVMLARVKGRHAVWARWLLAASWFVAGGVVLYFAIRWSSSPPSLPGSIHDWSYGPKLLLAGAVGGVMSCIWLGWYFAVSLVFNAHNNEAGGGARIEKFKQFVRIRLTKDGLTGFVIAVNQPQKDGRCLKPKIVDVFELRC